MARPEKIVRVLFDEYHSESWSVSLDRAREIQPEDPCGSSFFMAASLLSKRDFVIQRNLSQPLDREGLSQSDVVVLLHPCNSKMERTTNENPPRLSGKEIGDLLQFVRSGGGLVVVSEYNHDQYGDNLNELLRHFHIQIENTTVSDPDHCASNNPLWVLGSPSPDPFVHPLHHGVESTCFYRTASCSVIDPAHAVWTSSPTAQPPQSPIIAVSNYGDGRVVVIGDSSLFGDKHLREYDHEQLWINLFYWCSFPTFSKSRITPIASSTHSHPSWMGLKTNVETLRTLQDSDGSVSGEKHSHAQKSIVQIRLHLKTLAPYFCHQQSYLDQLQLDLSDWVDQGFPKPDFGKSLRAFNPEAHRVHLLDHLVLFPMYTPNASSDTRFESIIFRTFWPDWLAELEQTTYSNSKFIPCHFVDMTQGYQSQCAVLFPETVSLVERPTNQFGGIFCDREAARLQKCALQAAQITHLEMHPQLECFLHSLPVLQNTLAFWDLIHDTSHSLGELPFDPFMIRKRAPYWMYALEELRVDLRSFQEAHRMAQNQYPYAQYVKYAILLDRIFRFPITGARIRNYDSLGGALLFSYLHQSDVLLWSDNRLSIRWDQLPGAIDSLAEELRHLYKSGSDYSKMTFWIAAHDLISKYLHPNVASVWAKSQRIDMDENDLKHWISLVHEDEFPLGNFHGNLMAQMKL